MKIKELIEQLMQIERNRAGSTFNDVCVESLDVNIPRLIVETVIFSHLSKETIILVEPKDDEDD